MSESLRVLWEYPKLERLMSVCKKGVCLMGGGSDPIGAHLLLLFLPSFFSRHISSPLQFPKYSPLLLPVLVFSVGYRGSVDSITKRIVVLSNSSRLILVLPSPAVHKLFNTVSLV